MTSLDEILAGMGGLDIDFTYEDGLRLSELAGQLADAQYHLEHMLTSNLWVIMVPVALAAGFVCTVWFLSILDRPVFDVRRPLVNRRPRPRADYGTDPDMEDDIVELRRRQYEEAMDVWKASVNRRMLFASVFAVALFAVSVIVCYIEVQASYEADVASYTAQIEAILDRYGVMA